jgi:hypothetical protein
LKPATFFWRSAILSSHVVGDVAVKVAVTLLAAFIVTLQTPVPVQAPDQLLNRYPAAGTGVRVTTVPAL